MRRTLIGPRAIETRWLQFHPTRYGIATLMRLAVILPSGRKLMLHKFLPHCEEDFHDHPWAFRTLVLWGAYRDESLGPDGDVRVDILRRGTRRYRPARHAHRTSCTCTTWTLVLTSPKERQWELYRPGRGAPEPYCLP